MTDMKQDKQLRTGPGYWASPVTATRLFEAAETVSFLRVSGDGLFFLLSIPAEGNALALMYRSGSGQLVRVSPQGFNLRSQVHEYGGLSYAFTADTVFYCNFNDQRLYRQGFDQQSLRIATPYAMTPCVDGSSRALRYADLLVDPLRQRLICIREDHRPVGREPCNTLVAIPFTSEDEGEVLFGDSDFVASPCLSEDGLWLSFQTWSHPNMPWDETQIQLGALTAKGELYHLRQVCPDRPGALLQPRFSPQGELYFLADWSNWWNLYRIDAEALKTSANLNAAVAVTQLEAELCGPQWQVGQRSYDFGVDGSLLFGYSHNCRWTLASLDVATGSLRRLGENFASLENICHQQGCVVFQAATDDQAAAIVMLPSAVSDASMQKVFQARAGPVLEANYVSRPEHFSYSNQHGSIAYGLYYPPRNPGYPAHESVLPPLLVSVHGGPTGSAKPVYNPAVQYWTSRGYGWLDVNHRGSAGYGRRFRQSLYGHWGLADIEDVVGAVQRLIATAKVDPHRIAIRGGSAGGYVVLAALANSDLFRAGVSYYGICDLERLAQDTHKFESRYLDQLIGPYPEQAVLYRERSPLYHIETITAPVLLLQGKLDKVVPSNQAEQIYAQLHAKTPLTQYLCFSDEGHGFRKPVNQIAALETEQRFYELALL